MTFVEILEMTDGQAREYRENIRWPHGPACPHCGSMEATPFKGEAHRSGVYQCNNCRNQYPVMVGTVMESSHIPLKKWVAAFHLICSSKKGISSAQLQRDLKLGSYRTAWFMTQRIREGMLVDNDNNDDNKLNGTVEVDETYVGGKPRYKGTFKRGRGTNKKPVMALVERDGKVRTEPVERVDTSTLKQEIRDNVNEKSTIVTDEYAAYNGIGDEYEGGHHTVNHGSGEYVKDAGDWLVHTNTGESFFALMKRGHYGGFHHLSKKHLHRYSDEFSFRWNHRTMKDGEISDIAVKQADGNNNKEKQSR